MSNQTAAAALMGVLQRNGSIASDHEIENDALLKALQEIPQKAEEAEPEPDYLAFLNDSEIDFQEEMAPPPVCLEIVQADGNAIIGTRGNFSMVIGKAKSRKTFFITIALAAAVKTDPVLGLFKGSLPTYKNTVLYFDTEQGRYHVQKAARRVLYMSGSDMPDNFKAYGLRKFNPQERLKIIEKAIETIPNVGLVVIDGIRDLVSSINDEELATMLASKLLKWTEEKELHIMCVLHQNKNDNNARGHLGSELVNKAETVLSITKDSSNKEVSIVESEFCREKEFEPFAFDIDNFGIPHIVEDWTPTVASKYPGAPAGAGSKKKTPGDHAIGVHSEVLKLAFKDQEKPTYKVVQSQIKYALSKQDIPCSDAMAREFITWYQNEGMIATSGGTPGTKACYYTLEIPTESNCVN